MAKTGKYIYGIINSNANFRLFVSEDSIHTIPSQDISAVVGDSEIVDYTCISKGDVAKMLIRHQKVLEKIMNSEVAVIPMKLGTFAVDEIEVKDVLDRGYSLIKETMEKAGDKIEIDIVATWSDFTSILKEVGEEKEIKEFKERLLASQKEITITDQMKIGLMVKKALDIRKEKYAEKIKNTLETLSKDLKMHELMDDKMVSNIAFLINKTQQNEFDRKIEALNTEFHDELNFRCVGPLPPYSFYTLEIKKMQFGEIDWAKKKLGLNDFADKDEIKKAYRRVAASSHPDRNQDIPAKIFDDVNKANKILIDYCKAREQAGEKEFEKNAVLIKVRE